MPPPSASYHPDMSVTVDEPDNWYLRPMSVRAGVPEEFGGRGIPPPTEARGYRLSLDVARSRGAAAPIEGRVESDPGPPAERDRRSGQLVRCTAAWVDIAPQLVGRGRLGLASAYELRARARPIWLDELIFRDTSHGRAARRLRQLAAVRVLAARLRAARVRGDDVRVPLRRRGGRGRAPSAGRCRRCRWSWSSSAATAGDARRDDADRHLAPARVAVGGRAGDATPARSRCGSSRGAGRHAGGRRDARRRDPPAHGSRRLGGLTRSGRTDFRAKRTHVQTARRRARLCKRCQAPLQRAAPTRLATAARSAVLERLERGRAEVLADVLAHDLEAPSRASAARGTGRSAVSASNTSATARARAATGSSSARTPRW